MSKLKNSGILPGKRILFVDDEELLREATVDILRDRGAEVSEAKSGANALELMRKEPPFDLVISDMRMPDGGADFILSGLTPEIRPRFFIVLTGFSDKETSELLSLGANEVIDKPFAVAELLERLQFWLSSS